MHEEKVLTEVIEEVVDKTTTTAEEIHRSIADMPIGVLERVGLAQGTLAEVRRVQDASIGAIYDLVRDVNHKVSRFATDLLFSIEEDRDAS